MIVGMESSGSERSLRGVSIIVPTRDRPQSLARCLDALERQSDVDSLEIIVVDDGSVQARPVAEAVATSPRARLVRSSHSGPAAARNTGAAEARHRFIFFLDDDCEPKQDWVALLAAALENGADVAFGKSVNPSPDDPLVSASQTIVDFLQTRPTRSPGTRLFAPGHNLGCKKEVVARVSFNERHGVLPGEDRDWCAQVLAGGYSIVPVPAAVVFHRQQLTVGSFWSKHVAYGRGSYRFRRAWSQPVESPRYYLGLMRVGFESGFRAGCFVLVAQAATAVGYAREVLGRDRRV